MNAVETQDGYRNTIRFWWLYQEDRNVFDPVTMNDTTVISQRRTGLSAQHDHFIDEKTYWLLNGLVEDDLAAGVDLRWTVGAGLGRQFRDDEEYEFSGEAGINYFVQKLNMAPDQDHWALRCAYKSHWTPNERYEVIQIGEILPALEYIGKKNWVIYAKLDTTAKVTLSENLYAALQWVLDWNSVPPPGAAEANNRVFLTVGWSI